MPRDISGTYTLPLAPIEPRRIPVVNWVNPTVEDIEAALNNIPGDALAPGTVDTAQLADGAVTNPKLADNAVTGPKVQDNSIPLTKLQGLPASPGLLANTGSGLAARTITGTANQISVANGSGAAGDPVLSIPSSPAFSGTVSLLDGQLQFPATQNPSSDPNTLDDYEEGTFTPVISAATPGNLSVSYTAQGGFYRKIGGLVYIYLALNFTPTYTTASGELIISGLPFPCGTETPFSISYFSGRATGTVPVARRRAADNSALRIADLLNNATFTMPAIPTGTNSIIILGGCYHYD